MRFENEGNSGDIQDRRGMGPVGVGAGLGLGGMVLVGIVALLLGVNPLALLGTADDGGGRGGGPAGPRNGQEAQSERVVRAATTDIENFWTQALPAQSGRPYQRTQLVLFDDETRSACGAAEAQTGPFYCPADHLVYVDLGFFGELASRFGAPGDFAQAYVLAHEFGHHVQDLLGIDQRAHALQQQDPGERNQVSVALELQADCFAGVWGASAARRGLLDPGDMEEGLAAAAAVGDDRLQRMAGRSVSPESFTHGSSQQRVAWFRQGYQSGNIHSCDTFGHGTLSP